MTTLIPVITEAGLEAVMDAVGENKSVQLTHIVFGDASYEPVSTQTALASPHLQVPFASSSKIDGAQIHFEMLADGPEEFYVREVGFLTSDGVLLAVWSEPGRTLTFKSKDGQLILKFDLAVNALPANSITIQGDGVPLNLSMASELIRMATALVKTMHREIKMHKRMKLLEIK